MYTHSHTQHIREILQHNRKMQRVFHERKEKSALKRIEKAKFVHREKMKTVQQVRKDKLKAQTAYMRKIKSYKIRARESHQDVTRMKMNLKLQKLDRMVCDYVLICHYSFPCARLHVGVRW